MGGSLESYRLYKSPYALGKGDTGVADTDDHEAIFYNPAGLAQGKGIYKETVFASPSVVFSSDTKNLVRKITVENDSSIASLREHVGKNQHISVTNFTGIVFRRAAIGAIANTTNNLLLYKSAENRGVEILEAESTTTTGLTFSFAEAFFKDSLMLGTTLKYLRQSHAELNINVVDAENLSDQLSSDEIQNDYTGFGGDFGLLWNFGNKKSKKTMGLHVENVGGLSLINNKTDGKGRKLPQLINFGLGFDIGTRLSSMKFNFDFRDLTNQIEPNFFKKIHIGSELSFASVFGFTGGVNQGYPTAGLFVNLYLVRMDVGITTQEVGDKAGARADERFFIRIMSGF